MTDLKIRSNKARGALHRAAFAAVIAAAWAGAAEGCGGGTETTSSTGESSTSSSGSGGSGTGGATTSSSSSTTATTSSSSGTGGSAPQGCTVSAKGPTHGSAIALSADESRLVAVNRDAGSVTVMSIDYADGQPKLTKVAEIPVGGEPWQVAINGCDDTAYVVLRKDQKIVTIDDLAGTPKKGKEVSVGSEPTGLAITPNNDKIYVSNWVDGTLSVVDPVTMLVTGTIDLNAAIAQTGLLGTVSARPALAHPRSLAITNNGDASDTDETVYVTEWFALRTDPEDATGTNSDHNWKGILYKVSVGTGTVSTIDLPAVNDTGFLDAKGQATGCFPNQIGSVSLDGDFAYVTSTCASPVGPVGVFQRGACTATANCTGTFGAASTCVSGVCTLSCATDADCGPLAATGDCVLPAGQCKPTVDNAKTTTHPALTVVDLGTGTGTTTVLDKKFQDKSKSNSLALRVPLLPTELDFRPGFGYLAGQGADALFRLVLNTGAVSDVGSATNNFIDLRADAAKPPRLPIGVAVGKSKAFAFVVEDGTREIAAIDLNTQSLAGNPANADFRVASAAALPAAGSAEDSALIGKRFFNTGLGRWSLRGQGWGSCGACHIDGLTDNVTWYFARGPRQTISLDGSFASKDATDQRIFNWTAIVDEVADFEGNTRGISGGVGALVSTLSTPPAATDRINTAQTKPGDTPPQQGLQGSSANIADPSNPLADAHEHSKIDDWIHIDNWVKTIRSPRRPSNLVATDVAAGKAIFGDQGKGNCIGCHSGAKWTVSKMFYKPGDVPNDSLATPAGLSLSLTSWNKSLNGFPAALFPTSDPTKQFMRSGAAGTFEQIQCILRPVGTIKAPAAAGGVPQGVSDPKVNVLELRQDMKTGGQGSGTQGAADFTVGFNPPSLLGTQVGAPFFHAGNARTLEELFGNLFTAHHQSPVAQVFSPSATEVKQLVAYVLSIDEDETSFAIPAKGASGGDICFYP
ncbi:collagen triple helix repeat domain protein [Minicystis rosea]|nr:collagen triple helix repeat domain protein [Minicystis rosea]